MSRTPALTEARIRDAIHTVVDPCSRFNGTYLSLVELGMVEKIEIDGRSVHVWLLLDDPTCWYTFVIQREIREALSTLMGINEVKVDLVANEIWTEERMPAAARERLRHHREKLRARLTAVIPLVTSASTAAPRAGVLHE